MQIKEVLGKAEEDLFYKLPATIYQNDKNWIQPLNKDVQDVFDTAKNKAFRFGILRRWILQDGNKTIGRIAAFVNKKYKNKGDDGPVGGVGFFECIDNQQAANKLFDTAAAWLKSEGMVAMDGPINFGERDRWWGLVTKGFTEPLYCMNYNPQYYVALFEQYGFKTYFKQVCLGMDPKKDLGNKIWERHDAIAADPHFSARHISKKELKKYAGDFATVYNKAWAGHGGLKQMEVKTVELMFDKMKPVMDERLIWFAYYKEEPVAMFVNLPDLNQWFKHLHGKFSLYHKLKFLMIKTFGSIHKFTGIVFGVVPQWQGKGVDSYIVGQSAKLLQSNRVPYTSYEMQWIGDFNPKMLNVATSLGEVERSRELQTLRYNFDRSKPFERHPILN